MPTLIPAPTTIPVPGGKVISEYVGRVNTATGALSVAHMVSPAGWDEPAQTPDFDEYTLVLRGAMHVVHDGGEIQVAAGQAIITHAGERVRYSTPGEDGCEYVAICLPAFAPETVHREGDGDVEL